MENLLTWQALLVFVVAILLDVVWTLYIRRSGAGRAVAAANYAALIMALGALNVVSYTQNLWLVLPMILGNWVGTYLAVCWDRPNQQPLQDL